MIMADPVSNLFTLENLVFIIGAIAFILFLLWRRAKKVKGPKLIKFKDIARDEVKGLLNIYGEKVHSGMIVMRGLVKFARVLKYTEYNSLELKASIMKGISDSTRPSGKDIGDLSDQQVALDLIKPESEVKPKKEKIKCVKEYMFIAIPKGFIRSFIARRLPVWRTFHILNSQDASVYPDRVILKSSLQGHEYPLGSKIFVYGENAVETVDQIAFKVHSAQNLEALINFYEKMAYAEPLLAGQFAKLDKISDLNKKKQERQKESMYEDI
jgi:hypothetical protein